MRGGAGVRVDALLLVHAEGNAHQGLVVEVVQVREALVAEEELADVAGEVEGRVVLDGGDGHLLDLVHREVQVHPVLAVVDVAVVIDLIDLVVLVARVVHDHDVVVLEVRADVLLVEGLRSVRLRVHDIALGVGPGPGELGRGNAEAEREDAVDFLELGRLHRLQVRALGGLAQTEAVLPQLVRDLGAHLGGVVGDHALREHLGRNDAVLHDEVRHAGELAAVPDRVGEEPVDGAVVVRKVLGVDDALQEQVRLLQLVIEEHIVLGQDNRAHVELVDHLGTHHVEAGEQPAAAGGELVGAALGLHHVGEAGVHRDVVRVQGQGVDGRGVEGVAEGLVGGRPFVSLADFTEELGVDAALLVLGVERQGAGDGGENEQCFFHDSIDYQLFWSKREGGRSGNPPGRRRRPSRRCPTPSG